MEIEVKSMAASVKVRYELAESSLNPGGFVESDNIVLEDWLLGTREAALETIMTSLIETDNDRLVFYAVMPMTTDSSEKPQEAQEEPKTVDQVPEPVEDDYEGSTDSYITDVTLRVDSEHIPRLKEALKNSGFSYVRME